MASDDPYVKKLHPLESVIDESNIHGWLQAQISDAETRYAKLVVALECTDKFDLTEVLGVASEFGKYHVVSTDTDVMSMYEAFEDFFVNGMPCDRVNGVVAREPDVLSWEMTQDIHAAYWENGDCAIYYVIRKAVMDGMLAASDFVFYEQPVPVFCPQGITRYRPSLSVYDKSVQAFSMAAKTHLSVLVEHLEVHDNLKKRSGYPWSA